MAGTIKAQGSVILNDGGNSGVKDAGITVPGLNFAQTGEGRAAGEVFPTGTPTAFPLGEVSNPRWCVVKNVGDVAAQVGIIPSSGAAFAPVFELEAGEFFMGPWKSTQIPYHYNPNSAVARLQYDFMEK